MVYFFETNDDYASVYNNFEMVPIEVRTCVTLIFLLFFIFIIQVSKLPSVVSMKDGVNDLAMDCFLRSITMSLTRHIYR